MKFIIVITIALSCVGCFNDDYIKTGLEGHPLPSFDFLLMDSATKFKTDKIPTGNPFVLLYFSPNCPFCKAQIKDIIQNIRNFPNTHFYLLSSFPLGNLKKFRQDYKLDKYSNIIIAQDYQKQFVSYYNPPAIPCMAVYGKNKRLKQVLVGKLEKPEYLEDILY